MEQPETTKKASLTPKEVIYEKINGANGTIEVLGNRVLVAIPLNDVITTKSGFQLIRTDNAIDEDKWQGATGLVLQCGPGAFVDREDYKFYGQKATVGSWIFFRPSDGVLTEINGQPCRIIRDSYIIANGSSPDVVK